MRKTILFLMVVVMALALMGGLALAGGWTEVSYGSAGNDTDSAYWNPSPFLDGHPHGGFTTASNKCRVCHAVHLAEGSTWRLLKDASDASTECDGCHGPTGITELRPYESTNAGRGEHRRNAPADQDIPDSTGAGETTIVGGLTCNTCHSVHGADTLSDQTPNAYANTNWDGYILRKNPNKDTTELAQDAVGAPGNVAGGLADNGDAVKSGFCADCHNKNPNWGITALTDETGSRTNGTSHIQGPTAQGKLKVNGVDTSVAGFSSATYTAAPSGQTTTAGCRGCHSASDKGNNVVTNPGWSAFPHKTSGSKLLYDGYNGEGGGQTATDPDRALVGMDKVCAGCHDSDGDLSTAGPAGVGQTF